MRTLKEVQDEIAAHPRPRVTGPTFQAWQASAAAAKAWGLINPEGLAAWSALLDEERAIQEAERIERKSSIDALRQQGRLNSCGAGDRQLAAATDPKETPALEDVRCWLASGETWLLLSGRAGTGKSVAATWAVVEASRRGEVALYRPAPMVGRLSTFDDADEMRRLKNASLLVVDDMGTENRTEHSRGVFFELFDARHEGSRRTIITTNLTLVELRERMGDRIADRVRSDCVTKTYGGNSMRKGKQ